jgi:uncharacterized protein YbgA (DUF1722 family)/uncharacterized protein YbbK (DUF523 family)
VSPPPRLRLGVSSCLLGRKVRFDGGHKRDAFVVDSLGPFVEWVPVCPEAESGLGVPRESMRLVRDGEAIRLVTVNTRRDETDVVARWSARKLRDLAEDDLCGFVLKKDSPTCGLERVRVYPRTEEGASGVPQRTGRGLFAKALVARFPNLPIEEEGRLCDARIRENFIERLFAYERLRRLFRSRWTVGQLVAFHTAHKLTILAHVPAAYQRLGRLVAQARTVTREELRDEYSRQFMAALSVVATRGRHVNVLEHMLGYFKTTLDDDSRAELRGLIGNYGAGTVPLIVPLTLFKHHIRRLNVAYLAGQVYLDPHPTELMLRNHV